MEQELIDLKKRALDKITKIADNKSLKELFLDLLGKNGEFTLLIKKLKSLPKDQKPKIGQLTNKVKQEIEQAFIDQENKIDSSSSDQWFDVTTPGIPPVVGHLHPQTQVLVDLIEIFKELGYQVADGPEIETDWYNFGSLNFPKDHPARDTQQSLHLETHGKTSPGEIIMRTQTSAMQVRIMEKTSPPLRIIVPGKTYRYEQVDASHGFEFWQLEGFAIDRNITLTDLFGTISYILKKIIGENINIRFACTNFPFVEPGVDTYMQCLACSGRGCSFCKKSGWSEIMPAGMIHPNVLTAARIDPVKWQGFAFCIGLSRAVTMRFGMDDLRLLVNPDLRILSQF